MLAIPMAAEATANLSLTFTGVALPGSIGVISPYLDYVHSTSFAGEPVSISMTITGSTDALYVSEFSAQWSDDTYSLPYQTAAGGPGYPDNGEYDDVLGVLSSVNVTAAGGSISIVPTFLFSSETDGEFELSVNFLYGAHSGVTGGGTIVTAVNDNYRPDIGPYDGYSHVTFNLTGMTRAGPIPEPATWALMLIGFGGIGGALRLRRREAIGRGVRE
jgi:hypothetical protein